MITFLYTLTNKYLCNQPCGMHRTVGVKKVACLVPLCEENALHISLQTTERIGSSSSFIDTGNAPQ
jgi:hypothetical protein